jgi:hypothetical protein
MGGLCRREHLCRTKSILDDAARLRYLVNMYIKITHTKLYMEEKVDISVFAASTLHGV